MCGRFTNQYTWRELVDLYRITEPYIAPISNLEPRFNFAPMQRGVVVRLDKESRREPVVMRWGLVPSWSKDDRSGAAMINAKAETVAEKPAYRAAFKARPCLVVADGSMSGQRPGRRRSSRIHPTKGRAPFAFAGCGNGGGRRKRPRMSLGLRRSRS